MEKQLLEHLVSSKPKYRRQRSSRLAHFGREGDYCAAFGSKRDWASDWNQHGRPFNNQQPGLRRARTHAHRRQPSTSW